MGRWKPCPASPIITHHGQMDFMASTFPPNFEHFEFQTPPSTDMAALSL
jgi:hypothetical protein